MEPAKVTNRSDRARAFRGSDFNYESTFSRRYTVAVLSALVVPFLIVPLTVVHFILNAPVYGIPSAYGETKDIFADLGERLKELWSNEAWT